MSDSIADRMTKSQLVEQIRRFNASAPREWLEAFDFRTLERYLDRLRPAAAGMPMSMAMAAPGVGIDEIE
jgi:hypothetical protein